MQSASDKIDDGETYEAVDQEIEGRETDEAADQEIEGRETDEAADQEIEGRETDEAVDQEIEGRETDEAADQEIDDGETDEAADQEIEGRGSSYGYGTTRAHVDLKKKKNRRWPRDSAHQLVMQLNPALHTSHRGHQHAELHQQRQTEASRRSQ